VTPIETSAHQLYEALAKALTQNGRIRVEDLISASAAIVGEAIIGAAGEYNPRDHKYAPGSRVLSQKVNILFCGDADFDQAPADSVVGILHTGLLGCGFVKTDFPDLKDVFTSFVANIGKASDWGKVPLSIAKDHYPFIMPLRVTYETRAMVDNIFAPLDNNQAQRLQAATLALSEVLCKTRDALNRCVAITLALETVNGMAKTAPMTDAAMEKLKSGQKS
jgi:hypothetical protein